MIVFIVVTCILILLIRLICSLPDRVYTIVFGCRGLPLVLRHPLLAMQSLLNCKHKKNVNVDQAKSLLIVLGSGGHTAEMLTFLSGFDHTQVQAIHIFLAKTDLHSQEKAEKWFESKNKSKTESVELQFHKITRSREVGQSFFSTIFTTILGLCETMSLYCNIRPNVVLCNGPGTCLPIVYCGILSKIFFISQHTRFIFIESFARVQSLSLTGILVYPVVDRFIVQWKQLQQKWPRSTEYIGNIF
jgi:beta-1,4-N-acetylglucosaminyltransferase